jgi:hypothetical protein
MGTAPPRPSQVLSWLHRRNRQCGPRMTTCYTCTLTLCPPQCHVRYSLHLCWEQPLGVAHAPCTPLLARSQSMPLLSVSFSHNILAYPPSAIVVSLRFHPFLLLVQTLSIFPLASFLRPCVTLANQLFYSDCILALSLQFYSLLPTTFKFRILKSEMRSQAGRVTPACSLPHTI